MAIAFSCSCHFRNMNWETSDRVKQELSCHTKSYQSGHRYVLRDKKYNKRKKKINCSSTLTPAHQSMSQTSCNHSSSANSLLIFLYKLLDNGRTRTKHIAWKGVHNIATDLNVNEANQILTVLMQHMNKKRYAQTT